MRCSPGEWRREGGQGKGGGRRRSEGKGGEGKGGDAMGLWRPVRWHITGSMVEEHGGGAWWRSTDWALPFMGLVRVESELGWGLGEF